MRHEIQDKPFEYLALALVIFSGTFAILFLPLDRHLQRWVISFTAGGYFLWSLYHHYHRGDLHLSIVIEYLLILALGLVFISNTLF